jgi:hypothetical protein
MDESQFWNLIEESKRASKADFGLQAESLLGLLCKLPPQDIARFHRIYHDHVVRAYTWDLWGAAYVIGGGCSDDGFDYFRDWLISRGRTVYEAAMRNPESLVDVVTQADADEHCEFEELRYRRRPRVGGPDRTERRRIPDGARDAATKRALRRGLAGGRLGTRAGVSRGWRPGFSSRRTARRSTRAAPSDTKSSRTIRPSFGTSVIGRSFAW